MDPTKWASSPSFTILEGVAQCGQFRRGPGGSRVEGTVVEVEKYGAGEAKRLYLGTSSLYNEIRRVKVRYRTWDQSTADINSRCTETDHCS